VAADPGEDVVGPALTAEEVQALFEDMVRPALQSDGGDIDLVKVEDNDVYVRLVGACSSCPSSTVTMKMGVERLLAEEFPHFRHLIQVA
jgi:Fe-S cluster biogenesis protein NfuA